MSKVVAGDLQLNVVEAGAGEPVLVFLHYWGGSAGIAVLRTTTADGVSRTRRMTGTGFAIWPVMRRR